MTAKISNNDIHDAESLRVTKKIVSVTQDETGQILEPYREACENLIATVRRDGDAFSLTKACFEDFLQIEIGNEEDAIAPGLANM